MSLSRTYSDEFFTTTASKHLDWMASQQFRINPLAEDFLANAKGASGGLQLEVPWDVQEHSNTTQVVTGYEAADTNVQTMFTAGNDSWAFHVRPVIYSWIDEAKNAGSEKIIDLIKARVENTKMALLQEAERRLLAERAIAGMTDLNTLNGTDEAGGFLEEDAIGSQGNTVHGVAKTTYGSLPGFQNQRYAAAGDASANLVPGVRHVANRIRQRTKNPTKLVGYVSFAAAEFYGDIVQTNERYGEGGADAAAMTTIKMAGIECKQVENMPDSGGTTGSGNNEWSVLFVDHNVVNLHILGGGKLNWAMEPWRDVGGGHSAKITFFKFGGQLAICDFGTSGIVYGADTY